MFQIPINTASPIYQATIIPAHEGFIVNVEEKIPQIPSVNINKIGNSISDAIRSATELEEESEIQALIRKNGLKIQREPEDFPPENILGPHIFVSFADMIGFLKIVYSRNIEALNNKKA